MGVRSGDCFGLAGLIVQVLSLVMGGGTRMVGLVRLEVFQLWNGYLSTLLRCFVLGSLVQRRTILGLAGTAVQVLLPVMGGGMRMVGLADLRWTLRRILKPGNNFAVSWRAWRRL
jgi:hypothetical protein